MPNHIHGIIIINVGVIPCDYPKNGQPHGAAPTIGDMVQWYKTMTTNAYIKGVKKNQWAGFNGRLWQRNYYEHIIRDNDDLNRIRQYIIDNALNWDEDENNPNHWRK